jgi:hypothetical protein
VWAEYFALRATQNTWKLIIPSLPAGAIGGALWVTTGVVVSSIATHELGLLFGLMLGAVIWVTLLVFLMRYVHAWTAGSLALFNGLTLFLAVYFTGSIPSVGPMVNPYWVVAWSFVWTVLMAYFGWFLGWLNIALTFPKEVTIKSEQTTISNITQLSVRPGLIQHRYITLNCLCISNRL